MVEQLGGVAKSLERRQSMSTERSGSNRVFRVQRTKKNQVNRRRAVEIAGVGGGGWWYREGKRRQSTTTI